jgi:hypothetical protein
LDQTETAGLIQINQNAHYQNKIAEYINDTLPFEFDKTLTGLNLLTKTAYGWLNSQQFISNSNVRDKAVILELIANLYKIKWDLLTNNDSNELDRARRYVVQMKKELDEQIMINSMSWDDDDEDGEEEENDDGGNKQF